MRFTLLLFICLALFSTNIQAQEKKLKVKYGKISPEELAMTSYPADPSAAAVVLFDKGEYSHRYTEITGFNFEFERHVRIKIFNKEAYEYADIRIEHLKSQKITDLKACSYNLENGEIVETKLTDENVFDENLTSRISVKKLTIPAVKEGTIIEYKYTQKDSGLPDWPFQQMDIPTVWSEFKASVPTFVEFKKQSQGWVPFSLTKEEERTLNIGAALTYTANEMHFIQENIPALKPEPFVLSPSDHLSKINFDIRTIYRIELVRIGSGGKLVNRAPLERNDTWTNLGKELIEESFDTHLKSSKYTEDDAVACTAGATTNAEKIAAIYAFVGKNYQAREYDYIWATEKMELLAKNRKGSPSDLNLVFINMLRRAKINAYPVAISTRENGRILGYRVSADAFDRIITAIENEDKSYTVVDASSWPNPIGLLPEEDLNGEGLLMKDKDAIGWIPLQNKILVRSAIQADFSISEIGELKGTLNFSESGYGATYARQLIKLKDANIYLQEKFKVLLADASMSNIKMENLEAWQEPSIKGGFDLQGAGFVTVSGNKMYLNPSLGLGLKENPFKTPERKFDIELGVPRNRTYILSYKLPAGYKVEEAPKPTKMTFGENALVFEYYTEITPETLKITIRQNIKLPYIFAEEYADLQQYYGNIVSKLEEQVVLTKL